LDLKGLATGSLDLARDDKRPFAFEIAGKHAQLVAAMVKKLLHTRYRVTDLEKTVSFYRDVLGLQETRRHTSGRGSQLVFFKAPGSEEEIEICKFDESGPVVVGPDLTHLAFEVDDIEQFARESAKKGYPLSDGPHPNGKDGAIAFIDAPEGYEIELIQRGRTTS
jgi:lactoylglutathione lyase